MAPAKRPPLRRALSPRALPWALAALVALAVLLLDQLTKRLVEHSILPGETRRLLPGIQLVHTRNHGVAFGFIPGHELAVTILIALALAALLLYFVRHAHRPLLWLPVGMLLGGALGNILDRLRAGSVTDFLKLPLGWPPFNLADLAITLGVLLLFLLHEETRREGAARPHGGAPPEEGALPERGERAP
ncbi:MAG TPA: signal peptidase II [Solirubrobacteraceae bacterium]|nr:signal peptidase II [Solirubrobacteraceae bacterium]